MRKALSLSSCISLFACKLLIAAPPPTLEEVKPPVYPPLPEAVTSFGAIQSGDWLYVYGGHQGARHAYSSNEVSGSCHRLNLRKGVTWEPLPSGTAAQSPGLVFHDAFIYRVGGMAARNAKGEKRDLHSLASVERLRVGGDQWERCISLPQPRSSHDAAMVGGQLYVAGGWHLAGSVSEPYWHQTALVLNLREPGLGWQSFSQPFTRRGLCLAVIGTRLYCLGGMNESDQPSLAVDVLDTATGQWHVGPGLPDGKMKGFGSAACVVDERLYCSTYPGGLWRLKRDESGWEEIARLRQPRFFHRVVPGGSGWLVALGGAGQDGKMPDLEVVFVD